MLYCLQVRCAASGRRLKNLLRAQRGDRLRRWAPDTGFATLAFGATRDFQIKNDDTNLTTTTKHEAGQVIYFPYPLNHHNTHSIPKRKRVKSCRISLTFREIEVTLSKEHTADEPRAGLQSSAAVDKSQDLLNEARE